MDTQEFESTPRSRISRIMLAISGIIMCTLGILIFAFSGPLSNSLFSLVCGIFFLAMSISPPVMFHSIIVRYVFAIIVALLAIYFVFNNTSESTVVIWLFPLILLVFYELNPVFSASFAGSIFLLFAVANSLKAAGFFPGSEPYPLFPFLRFMAAYAISCVLMFFSRRLHDRLEGRLMKKNRELIESIEGTRLLSQELEMSRKNYMEIIRRSTDGIVLVQDGKIVFCNTAFLEMGGFGSSDVLGNLYSEFITRREEDFRTNEDLSDHLHYGAVCNTKNGDSVAVEINIGTVQYYGRNSSLVFVRDVRVRKLNEERLRQLAYYDELTSLYNRKSFYEKIERALDLGKRRNLVDNWALLYIDLDNFKDINDSLGHGAGDEVLLEVTRRLRESVRDSDDIFRIAGDEFAVILGTIAAMTDAGYVARKILHALAEPFTLLEREISITASIGVSIFPKDGTEADILIKNADMAMYEAKKQKNRYHFFDTLLDRELEKRIEISRDLRKALENEEFSLYYQPIVDDQKRVISAEALIRWIHPEKGLLAPGYFLSIAEETGFIKEIEKWVIQSVCAQIRTWLDKGMDVVPISLNITAFLLSDPNFLTYFTMYTERYSISSHYLKVEITESSSMSNPDDVRKKMEQLAEEGFAIMIDDFGTGYSSLAYLNRFPAQTLKIDRSFIHPIPGDLDAAVLVSSIVTLAHNLGFSVVAEGVETEEQNSYLKSIACDLQQGYLYSPPVPVADFEVFLSEAAVEADLTEL